jgi:Glycosyl transferases group 1
MAKRKIVQIESFYGKFLESFLAENPFVSKLPYKKQLQILFDSGWSSGQNVVPYLNPAIWDTHYLIPTCDWLQRSWALENGLSPDTPLEIILFHQLQKISPDVIYLSDIPCFNFGLLDSLRNKPFMVGWHATALSPQIQWPKLDLVLSGIKAIRMRALELGAKSTHEFMSASPNYRHLSSASSSTENINIGFAGSFFGGLHEARARLLFETASKLPNQKIDIFTANPFCDPKVGFLKFHPPVFGSEVVTQYSKCNIVVDIRADFGLPDEEIYHRETSNMRIFEATRAGSFLLAENCTNLGRYFEIGREIDTFSSNEELLDKINYYLDDRNVDERLKISQHGYKRAISEHSIEKRAEWFAKILEDQ